MATPEGTHNYAYDTTYRLTSADHPAQADEAYAYDKAGNRKTSSQYTNWAYDANNRLTSCNGTTFSYDQNGNTLSKTKDAQTTSYTYDYENRLIAISGTTNAGYTYDPFGKRLSKTVAGVTKYYLYDNEDIIAEYDSAGNIVASYVHGQGIDEPIYTIRYPLNANRYYTFDGLGTVSELTDNSQSVVESYKYDAFGNLQTPPATGNPYTYTGREYDPESGLYYYRTRYYNPSLGRFITTDPIWYDGRINFYVYVENDPVNYIDPSGKWGQKAGSKCNPCKEKDYLSKQISFQREVLQLLETGQSISGKGKPVAVTRCIFGIPFITYYIDIQTCYGKCTYEHEQVHARQCREGKINPFDPGFSMRDLEIEAYRVSLACMESLI